MTAKVTPLQGEPEDPSPELGGNTEEIRVLLPEEAKEHLTFLAVQRGMRLGPFIRDILLSYAYGELAMSKRYRGRAKE